MNDSGLRKWFRAIPLPLMVALLLIAAAWRIQQTNIQDTFSTTLITAAMILLGAWIREYTPLLRPPPPKDETEEPES